MDQELAAKWLAMETLARALKDYAGENPERKSDMQEDARLWIKDNRQNPFSFKWCVSQSGLSFGFVNRVIALIESGHSFKQATGSHRARYKRAGVTLVS